MTAAGQEPVKVLLVDDHALLVQTLLIALRAHDLHAEAAPLDSVASVTAAAEAMPADLVLLDLDLGDPIGDGTALVAPLVATGARVLVLTGADTGRSGPAIERGAVGAVRKDVDLVTLLRTVVAAAEGGAVMDLRERRAVVAAAKAERLAAATALVPFERLSAREAMVLRALAEGRTVTRIAAEWVVSESTVRTHVRGVLMKLGVGTQLEAVAVAHRAGWIGNDA